ncbi:putative Phospholipid-transporting ATPase 3 [Blattamonas nauphoetae]|uniref:Phospholipid-transporting ATPase 3 n=1 Tax=Blattamonas nauphoetae TaxID=2049346 RepID=A0ABQ9X590_9EUKA|nr:putative Phospholipid-transporting ATPase 3 [Blattamonas nauphoetae]
MPKCCRRSHKEGSSKEERQLSFPPQSNAVFCNNAIKSSHYTLLTFLPKILFEQLMQFSKLPTTSIQNPVTAILPVVFIFCLSFVREGIEDFLRHRSDKKINRKLVRVWNGNSFQDIFSQDVKVGDIVLFRKDEEFCVDGVIVSTSDPTGICYINSMNLDGETNMKLRRAAPALFERIGFLQTSSDPELVDRVLDEETLIQSLRNLSGTIVCQAPCRSIHEPSINGEGVASQQHTLSLSNFCLRGFYLKNIDFVLCVAVYTGKDTKMQLNMKKQRSKTSRFSRRVNVAVAFLFVVQFVQTLIGSVLNFVTAIRMREDHGYLYLTKQSPGTFFIALLTCFGINGYFIPVSLFATIEVVRVVQSLFILADHDITDNSDSDDGRTNCRTSSLIEELGRVKHIFSDKTGTLTKNKMTLRAITTGSSTYHFEDKFVEQEPDNTKVWASVMVNTFNRVLMSLFPQNEGGHTPNLQSSYPTFGSPMPDTPRFLTVNSENVPDDMRTPVNTTARLQPHQTPHMPQSPLITSNSTVSVAESQFIFFNKEQINEIAPFGPKTPINQTTTSPLHPAKNLLDVRGTTGTPRSSTITPTRSVLQLPPNVTHSLQPNTEAYNLFHFVCALLVCHEALPEMNNDNEHIQAVRNKRKKGLSRFIRRSTNKLNTASPSGRRSAARATPNSPHPPSPSASTPPLSMEGAGSTLRYQSTSPDDIAILTALSSLGLTFAQRTHHSIDVFFQNVPCQFKILAFLPFSSARRRMSILVEFPDRTVRLYMKGADSTVIPLCAHSEQKEDGDDGEEDGDDGEEDGDDGEEDGDDGEEDGDDGEEDGDDGEEDGDDGEEDGDDGEEDGDDGEEDGDDREEDGDDGEEDGDDGEEDGDDGEEDGDDGEEDGDDGEEDGDDGEEDGDDGEEDGDDGEEDGDDGEEDGDDGEEDGDDGEEDGDDGEEDGDDGEEDGDDGEEEEDERFRDPFERENVQNEAPPTLLSQFKHASNTSPHPNRQPDPSPDTSANNPLSSDRLQSFEPPKELSPAASPDLHTKIVESIDDLSREGLRTLAVATRELPSAEYSIFQKAYATAQLSIANREDEEEEAFRTIERQMELVGGTAVEDELQDDCAETVEFLKKCNCRVWMLTGDKVDTAVNIANSAKIFAPSSTPLYLTNERVKAKKGQCQDMLFAHYRETGFRGDIEKQMKEDVVGLVILDLLKTKRNLKKTEPKVNHWNRMKNAVLYPFTACKIAAQTNIQKKRMSAIHNTMDRLEGLNNKLSTDKAQPDTPIIECGVVVDGATIQTILASDYLISTFLTLCQDTTGVVCCRIAPMQKALIVRMVRRNDSDTVTLAIGDGANDVSMIQEANVGIGIRGKEGTSASRNADFSIPKFSFVKRLMVVHGSSNYIRLSEMVKYHLGKNVVFVVPILANFFTSAFSFPAHYEPWFLTLYNLLFLVIPPGIIACFHQHLPTRTLMSNPSIYRHYQNGHTFSSSSFLRWFLACYATGVWVFFVSKWLFGFGQIYTNGRVGVDFDYSTFEMAAITVVAMNLYFHVVNGWTLISVSFGFLTIILFCAVMTLISFISTDTYHHVFFHVLSSPTFYLALLLICVPVSAAILIGRWAHREFNPSIQDALDSQNHSMFRKMIH